MIKRAVITGLTAAGVNVADLRVLPAAVSRHLLKMEGYDAGVHVTTHPTDPEVVRIQFSEPPGISLTPALQKEIEKHFSRGELRRVGFNEVGSITYPARVRESYATDLLDTLDMRGDPRAELPDRRRLRLLRGVVRAAARPRAARCRGGRGARVHHRARPGWGGPAGTRRADEAARGCDSAPTSASSSTAGPSACISSTSRRRRSRSTARCCSSSSSSARTAGWASSRSR